MRPSKFPSRDLNRRPSSNQTSTGLLPSGTADFVSCLGSGLGSCGNSISGSKGWTRDRGSFRTSISESKAWPCDNSSDSISASDMAFPPLSLPHEYLRHLFRKDFVRSEFYL